MLWASILSTVLAKYGLQHADQKKWLPKNHYQRKAIECLKKSDIAGAIDNNVVVLRKDPDYEEAQIVRELILMSLDTEMENLDEAIQKNTAEIETLEKSLRTIQLKHIALVILHSAALPIITLLLLFFSTIITEESITSIQYNFTFILVYSISVFSIGFVYMKYFLFNEFRSPVIRYREIFETIRYKISVYEQEVKKIQLKIKEYNRLRENSYSNTYSKAAS